MHMKRAHLLTYLRVAGYHNDAAAYTRLLIENRISMKAAKQAFAEGVRQRENGVKCDCQTCKVARARAGANARQAAMCANFGYPPKATHDAEATKKLGPPELVRTHRIEKPSPGGPFVTHAYDDGSITFGCVVPELKTSEQP